MVAAVGADAVVDRPLSPADAWQQITDRLAAPASWVPGPTESHAELIGALIERHDLRGDLSSDAHLAALAIEHGLEVCSTDTDLARFAEISWRNPLD